MLRFAGALCIFSLEQKAWEVPQYAQNNLGECFNLLKFVYIPLRQADSVSSGTVTNGQYFRNSSFFLALNARIGVDDRISKTALRVLVAPTDEIQNLIPVALPGIILRHVPAPPSALPLKHNNQYFSLNQSSKLWERVTQTRNISLHIPSEFVEARPELLVVLP